MKKHVPLRVFSAVVAASAAGFLIGRMLASRRLRHDVEQLFAHATDVSARIYHETQLAGLPAPAQRYFRHVLRDGQPYLSWARLRHGGQFRTDLAGDWVDITGEQWMTADPPGFIWQGTTRWFTARDAYVAGQGGLTVRLLGAVPILYAQGPTYDQGELLRWLGESALLPTNLLPSERVNWQAVNDRSAHLTLSYGGQTITYLVRFNAHDEIEQCETERYQNPTTRLPWLGRFSRYREIHGVRVPTELKASWMVNGQRQSYARFLVEELEYDQPPAL